MISSSPGISARTCSSLPQRWCLHLPQSAKRSRLAGVRDLIETGSTTSSLRTDGTSVRAWIDLGRGCSLRLLEPYRHEMFRCSGCIELHRPSLVDRHCQWSTSHHAIKLTSAAKHRPTSATAEVSTPDSSSLRSGGPRQPHCGVSDRDSSAELVTGRRCSLSGTPSAVSTRPRE
jgi:hypothetical protein